MYNSNYIPRKNSELRAMARTQLSGNWGSPILICLIFTVLCGLCGATAGVGWMVSFIIVGPLSFGLAKFFMNTVRLFPTSIETLFDGFKLFSTTFMTNLLTTIFIMLWSLLLVIPGIIAALSYSLSYYILNDNPNLSGMDAIRQSKKMMNGFKTKLFLLYLSFIGWGILCLFTLGIGTLFLTPYIEMSKANFYEDVKRTWENKNINQYGYSANNYTDNNM